MKGRAKFWFTADLHIGHRLVSEIRGYKYQAAHDSMIIDNWRKVVHPKDVVVLLGDIFWSTYPIDEVRRIWKYLPGNKIFVRGNHDRNWYKKIKVSARDLYSKGIVKADGTKRHVVCCHYPLLTWNRRSYGSIHLYGHCHNSYPPEKGRMDVGVDVAKVLFGEYRPISFEEAEYCIKSVYDSYEPIRDRKDTN